MERLVVFEDECEKLELVVTDGNDACVALTHHHDVDRTDGRPNFDIIEFDLRHLPALFLALAPHVDAKTRLYAAGVFDETLAALELFASGPAEAGPAPLRALLRDLEPMLARADDEEKQGGARR